MKSYNFIYILELKWRRVKKSPILTESQKAERLAWCLRNQFDDFNNHILLMNQDIESMKYRDIIGGCQKKSELWTNSSPL